MKSFATVTLALCFFAACQGRAEETNSAAVTIGSAQAADYIGKQVTVTGMVSQVSIRPSRAFLNFGKAYPNNEFTAVIRSSKTNAFEDLPALKGKSVAVKGKVTEYNGKPEMELTTKSQLKVLSEKK